MPNSQRVDREVPVIETERLRLRGHRLDDFDGCAAMWADPAVTRYIGGKPSTPQQSWSRLLSYLGHWTLMGFGYWAIESKATREFIGELGFADFKRDIQPSIRDTPELGWALVSRVHGNGYATEAVRAVVAWGDENLASPRTVCIVNPENLASIRIAEKVAFREFQRPTYNDRPIIMFCRDRRDS
jgi:RimJ/RimL family protein N-acetyltransferase